LNNTFAKLYGFPKPVVAAVNGSALAGGLFFVLAADHSVAREGIKLGLTEIRVGVTFPVGPLEIARDTLPHGAFRHLLLSGQPVEASRAVELGIVDEVTPLDSLMTRAESVARQFAALPPRTFAAVKAQMRAPALRIINSAIEAKSDPARASWFSDETIPAMKAMLDATRKQ
jgi:enoyl-CoA hydratase/carnithine racemase